MYHTWYSRRVRGLLLIQDTQEPERMRMKHINVKNLSLLRAVVASAILSMLLIMNAIIVQGFVPPMSQPLVIYGFQVRQQQKKQLSKYLSSLRPRRGFTTSMASSSCRLYQTNPILLSASVMFSGDAARQNQTSSSSSSSSPSVLRREKKNVTNKQIALRQQKVLAALPKLTVIALTSALLLTAWWKRQALLAFIRFVKNEWLVTSLNRCQAAGPMGLVLYTILFLLWEMTFGMTTPVEVASGLAFGAIPAIIANGLAKTGGAFLTFLLARHVCADYIKERIRRNEILSLMQESIQETPFRVALLCRFSPLPEFIKNAGMGVMMSSFTGPRLFLHVLVVVPGRGECPRHDSPPTTQHVAQVSTDQCHVDRSLCTRVDWPVDQESAG
jgi:uncharacterized membrane protein YdjX (TVP38/TMEM64 family)